MTRIFATIVAFLLAGSIAMEVKTSLENTINKTEVTA